MTKRAARCECGACKDKSLYYKSNLMLLKSLARLLLERIDDGLEFIPCNDRPKKRKN